MIQQIEIDIQNSLRAAATIGNDLPKICDMLWEKWKNASFDLFSINSFCSFLFQAQEWEKIILISISQIKKSAPVSWDFLGETLNKITSREIRKSVLAECVKFFESPNYEIPELKTLAFDCVNPQAKDWRIFFEKQKKRQLDEMRTTLMDQIQMFRHSNSFSENEKTVLIKLKKIYPKDPEIMKITEGAEIKEFKDILNKYGSPNPSEQRALPPETKDVKKFKTVLINECKKLMKDPENSPFDFVYLFIFLECYEEALLILERIFEFEKASDNKSNSEKANWLKMDLLMLDKRYSQALSWTDFLEDLNPLKYDDDKLSQIYYHRARCLWELNHKQMAIKTIESLLKWNPEYRIASHLLYEWKSAV